MQNFGEFFGDQIEYADTIVVSRTQTMDEAALGKCVKLLRQKNQKAAIITTPWEQLSAEIILSALEPADDFREQMCGAHHHHEGHHHGHDCGCHEHHHHEGHHHADEVFSSWGTETVHRFDRRELEDVLKLLSTTENFGTVLRAKGIVEGEDGQWVEFDMVPDAIQIRACPPDYTGRICVIGVALRTAELDQIFGR